MNSYFDGVEFVTWGYDPVSDEVQKDRYFDGYYGIQFTWRGRFEYAVDDEPSRIVTGHPVLLTRPEKKYYYRSPAGETRHHTFICFRGPRVRQWLARGLFPETDLIQLTQPEPFYAGLQQLLDILNVPGGRLLPRAVHLLEDLLLQLHEQPAAARLPAALREGLEKTAARIRRNPARSLDWSYEAQKLHISPVHFRRVFKALTGLPPLQFQLECRLQQAAVLLLKSDVTVAEAAQASGFDDVFYFSRVFKKHRKLTPSAYHRAFAARP